MRSHLLGAPLPALALAGFVGLFGAAGSACSSTLASPPESVAPDGGAAEGPVDAGAPLDEAAAAEAACAEVTSVLGPAVEASLAGSGSTDVAAAVITARCPFAQHVAGASKLAADARYRVGSITKTYTAAIIFQLVAAGSLTLDEPIARFSLGIPDEATITVRQLLNHSSGLYNYTDDPTFKAPYAWTPRERIANAVKHEPYFAPGAGFHYSNTNFIALGLIAESLGGAPIATLVRQRILEPRALRETYLDAAEPANGALAPSYDGVGRAHEESRVAPMAWADGAMVASLRDVTQWIRVYGAGEATPPSLSSDFVEATPGSDGWFGLGLMMVRGKSSLGAGDGFGHGGDIPGFHSLSFHFRAKGWTITTIANSDGGDPNVVFTKVVEAMVAQARAGGAI